MIKAIIKIITACISLVCMNGVLRYWAELTMFTTLSNIFIDIMLLISAVNDIVVFCKKKPFMGQKLYIVKFLATLSISVTFLVFMFILAPASGGIAAFAGTSFILHFFTPLVAIFDFIFNDRKYKPKNWHIFIAVLLPLIYFGYIVILAEVFHLRWYRTRMSAPYNFINYRSPTGWFGFDLSLFSGTCSGIGVAYMIVILIIIFALFAKLLFKLKRKEKAM